MKNPTEELTGHILLTLVVGYFACAQYDVRSPIGTSCHFACAADAPLLSLSRHFPRFSGGIYPEGGSKICLCEEAKRRSNLPGGWRSTEYKFRTFSVGYFACAQYDALFLYVILNDSEESHRRTDGAYTPHFGCGIFRVRSI